MNFVCLVFELGDKTTLSPMENLMVKCNHKLVCTVTEDGQKLEILDLESRVIILSV